MMRHHKLKWRQPELTSSDRVSGLNEVVVYIILNMSVNIFDENKITDTRIFSMDETSCIVLERPEKIMSQKDKHHVGAISPCE
jgi:hypothetical protein